MTDHSDETLESEGRPAAETREHAVPAAAGDGAQRVAIISDIHGNLPAFKAVVADIRETGVDEIWCLGDLIGYGAQPDECVALAKEECDVCLIGNHDLVVLDKLDIADFSMNAALAAKWTQDHIQKETFDFLNTLEPSDTSRAVGLYHASPRDPVWEYVLSALLADQCMDEMGPRIGVVGHSHVALYFWRTDETVASGDTAPGGTRYDMSKGRWIVNPGSVGQPRDGDPRAAWMFFDAESATATWNRVEYPIEEAARAIQQAGLPQALADRLYYGQ